MGMIKLPEGVTFKPAGLWVLLVFAVFHVAAVLPLALCFDYVFTWSGLVAMSVAIPFFAMGITMGLHRYFTHGGFKTSRAFEIFLALVALGNWEGSHVKWVAGHRTHHKHSDTVDDVHSPIASRTSLGNLGLLRSFMWAHVVWMFASDPRVEDPKVMPAKRLLNDSFHGFLHRQNKWMLVGVAWLALIFALGARYGYVYHNDWLRFGTSWLLLAGFLRIVIVWHGTWFVNSAAHVWGTQDHESGGDGSRNLWWVALISFGEGWHNNHHACQYSVRHGWGWKQPDPTYWIIKLFEKLGFVWGLLLPKEGALVPKQT